MYFTPLWLELKEDQPFPQLLLILLYLCVRGGAEVLWEYEAGVS